MFPLILIASLLISAVFALTGYEISDKKCAEFGRGKCIGKISPLIVGGADAVLKEFPHSALVGFGEGADLKYECGGALISAKYVLSAAHCTDSREFGQATRIQFGLVERDDRGAHMQERRIARIIPHPDYKRPIKYNDIALFELDAPVNITEFVRPACLNTVKDLTKFSDDTHAIGFGKTKFIDSAGNKMLRKVNLPIIPTPTCQPFFASMRVSSMPRGGLIDAQICAGTLAGGADTCQGDSGGPLQVRALAPKCNFHIVGVTSFGKFCGYAKSPAIYTNVYEYIPWIAKNVWQS